MKSPKIAIANDGKKTKVAVGGVDISEGVTKVEFVAEGGRRPTLKLEIDPIGWEMEPYIDEGKEKELQYRTDGSALYYGNTLLGTINEMETTIIAGMAKRVTAELRLNPQIKWEKE